jgi:hypothetical protein
MLIVSYRAAAACRRVPSGSLTRSMASAASTITPAAKAIVQIGSPGKSAS